MEISKLQWWLTNLNSENFADITKEIRETKFIQDRLDELVFEIFYVYRVRPSKEAILLRFVEFIIKYESDWNSLKNLIPSIFRFVTQPKMRREDADQVMCLRFLRKLYNKKLFSLKKVIDMCKKPPVYVYTQVIFLMVFFTPELLKENREEYLKQCKTITTGYTLNPQVRELLENPEDANINGLIDLLENSWKENSVERLVMQDKLEDLKKHEKFTNDYVVEPNYFEHNDYTRKGCSLLQFAAFYGAVDCFMYLLQFNQLNKDVCDAAVAGGNSKIIEKIQQMGMNVTLSLPVAAEYRQYDFVQKYITPEVCRTEEMKKIVDDVIEHCMYTNNLGLLIFLHNCGITKGRESALLFQCAADDAYLESFKIITCFPEVDINARNEDDWTALHKAASMGAIKIIKHLCTIPGLDVNAREKLGRTPLHIAAACDELEVVAFLLTITVVDPNCLDNWGRTPLHHAAANNATLVTKYLVKVKKVIINRTDNFKRTPKEVAPAGSECIDILDEAEFNLH